MILTKPMAVGGYYEYDDLWDKIVGYFINNHGDHVMVLTEFGGGIIFQKNGDRFDLMMKDTPSLKELRSWMWQRVEFSRATPSGDTEGGNVDAGGSVRRG